MSIAISKGHHEIADMLRTAAQARDPANPNGRYDQSGKTRLMHAIEQGATDTVDKMMRHPDFNPDLVDDQGRTALYYAARQNSMAAARLLLGEHAANGNMTTVDGGTALYIAAQKNHTYMVTLLAAHPGIDVNAALNSSRATPLHVAASKGYQGVVKALLDCPGIDCNVATTEGATPLYFAAVNGHVDIVRCLVERPTLDFDRQCNSKSATAAARDVGHREIASLLQCTHADARVRQGLPIPFDGQQAHIASMNTSDDVAKAIAAWRRGGMHENDLIRLRQDLDIYLLERLGVEPMNSEAFNIRYQEFFTPAIAVEDGALRVKIARLRNALPK